MALSRNGRRSLIAGVIGAIGWAAGILIIVRATPPDANPLAEYEASKQYEASIERIGGKSAVFGAEVSDFLRSLFQGARLGYTIGVGSLVVAGIFLVWTSTDRSETAE